MQKKIKKFDFNSSFSKDYEDLASIIIPAYKEIYLLFSIYLQCHLNDNASILSVGCGSGIELINLAQTNTHWVITGIDNSLAMLAMAKKKLHDLSLDKKTHLVHGTLDKINFENKFDAITCCFLLHILDNKEKLNLLKQIFNLLKPNGFFIMVDSITIENTLYNKNIWKHYEEKRGLSKDIMEQIILHGEQNRFVVSAEKLIALAAEAGFDNSYLFYNILCYSGWILKKNT